MQNSQEQHAELPQLRERAVVANETAFASENLPMLA